MTVTQAAIRAKTEILADIEAGTVPATVASFSELHDYVDANGYGGAFEDAVICADDDSNIVDVQANVDFWNEVQNAVDAWIKAGRTDAA